MELTSTESPVSGTASRVTTLRPKRNQYRVVYRSGTFNKSEGKCKRPRRLKVKVTYDIRTMQLSASTLQLFQSIVKVRI